MGGGRCRPSAWRPGTPWVETAATAHHGLGGERSAALTRSHARLQVRKPRLVVVCGLRLDCWTVVSLWLGANLFLLSRKQWWSGLGGEESQPGDRTEEGTAQIARLRGDRLLPRSAGPAVFPGSQASLLQTVLERKELGGAAPLGHVQAPGYAAGCPCLCSARPGKECKEVPMEMTFW